MCFFFLASFALVTGEEKLYVSFIFVGFLYYILYGIVRIVHIYIERVSKKHNTCSFSEA